MKIEPIQRIKLSHKVRERLLEMIQSNELGLGSFMPSEHELMKRFQVGRPAVREAMQSLESMGLIEIRQGGRARVKHVVAKDLLNQIDSTTRHLLSSSAQNVSHLREARRVLETSTVFLAVKRSTEKDIQNLKKELDYMKRSMRNRPEFLKSDLMFHKTIARMSKNSILYETTCAMLDWLAESHTDYEKDMLGIPELEDLTFQEHQGIYECIVKKDASGAAQQISDHIMRVNKSYHEYPGPNVG